MNKGGDAEIFSVSCARAGNCSAGGFYKDASGHLQAFVVNETSAGPPVLELAAGATSDSSARTPRQVMDACARAWGKHRARRVPHTAGPERPICAVARYQNSTLPPPNWADIARRATLEL